MKIQGLGPTAMPSLVDEAQGGVQQGKGNDFASQLMDVLKEVNQTQANSREMQTNLLTGQPVEIHDVMIAMERASMAMNLTLQVRNKMLDAYQEVMRLQV